MSGILFNLTSEILSDACGPELVPALLQNLTKVIDSGISLTSMLSCNSISPIYTNIFEVGICDYVFTGVYVVWINDFVIGAIVFFVICVMLVFGQFLRKQLPWYFVETEEDDEGDIELVRSGNFNSVNGTDYVVDDITSDEEFKAAKMKAAPMTQVDTI